MESKICGLSQLSDDELIKEVQQRLMPKRPDFSEIDKPVIYLVAATGIIENGGLRYFYENDFPDGVLHAEIAGCYRNIGMEKSRSSLRRVQPVSLPDILSQNWMPETSFCMTSV